MYQLDYILTHGLSLFTIIPLLAFVGTMLWDNKHEKPVALIVQFTKAFYLIAAVGYLILWGLKGFKPVAQHVVTLYETEEFVFAIQFYYDQVTAVFSIVGAILFFLVSTFSRYYMHRDEGYKRFFNTIVFFSIGYNVIIFSGNFETLFIGWEIIGLSSFLLIAFYRNRYLPVKNAFKTLSYYRLSDIGVILAMWMMHHLTHQNISFSQLTEAKLMAINLDHGGMAVFITLMLVLAATIKSAQVPFISWLPRAMEGPTSSSAIFYGSLSVHIGVFMLLRTFPFWEEMLWAKVLIIGIGAITAVVATTIAAVQPTVKTQIAYSSAAQIGIIFIEIALGFHILALVHFAGNAFLRTYQLLVSPSVLNYLVHHQYFHHQPRENQKLSAFNAGFYMLAIKEWNFDGLLFKSLWTPFKWIGSKLQVVRPVFVGIVVGLLALTLLFSFKLPEYIDPVAGGLPAVSLSIALALILFGFSHRGSALTAWCYLLIAHGFIMAGIGFNADKINPLEFILYGTGIAAGFVLGYATLQKMNKIDNDITLDKYHGYVYEQKNTALLFLLSALGLLGFPVTAAFIGIDVLFTYVHADQYVLITLLALCFLFVELAAIRIYCRIFLGLHKKLNHPVAFRSS